MTAIALDPLGYAHELETSGIPRVQAEVHAKAMTATFLYNFEAMVTRDYLHTRFTELETRVSANMDSQFTKVDQQMSEIRGTLNLHSWTSAVLMAGIFIPILQRLVA